MLGSKADGVVLNDVDFRRDSRYSSTYGRYGYCYQYYSTDEGKKKSTKKKAKA